VARDGRAALDHAVGHEEQLVRVRVLLDEQLAGLVHRRLEHGRHGELELVGRVRGLLEDGDDGDALAEEVLEHLAA